MYKEDLALNYLQWMICTETKSNPSKIKRFARLQIIWCGFYAPLTKLSSFETKMKSRLSSQMEPANRLRILEKIFCISL